MWNAVIALWLLHSVFLLVIPWYICTIFRQKGTVLTARYVRVPPKDGHADVSFWYATCVVFFLLPPSAVPVLNFFYESRYCVAGIILLLVCDILITLHLVVLTLFFGQLCALYYYVWIILLPKSGGYEIVEEVVELGGGALTTRLVRKYTTQIRSPEERPLLASPHD